MSAMGIPTFLQHGDPEAPHTVVLLHGIGSTARGWNAQMRAFPDRRVIAWNAPGYADSSALPTPQPVIESYTQALLALLDGEGVGQVSLVASSWGTPIAVTLAATGPARVRHLVLSGPSAGYGWMTQHEREALLLQRSQRARMLGIAPMMEQDGVRLVAPGTAEKLAPALAAARAGVTLDGYLQALHALAHADASRLVRDVPCPMLIVYGENDGVAPPAQHAERLAASLPGAHTRVLANCGHLPHVEHPDTFNDLVSDFIDA